MSSCCLSGSSPLTVCLLNLDLYYYYTFSLTSTQGSISATFTAQLGLQTDHTVLLSSVCVTLKLNSSGLTQTQL